MEQYCRICLVYDIEMKKFCDTEEIQFITNIFKQHGYNNIGTKTHYVCYICQALLTKSYNFVKRALRAQRVLHEFMKNDLVTENNMLQDIDRFKLKLNYNNLSIHQVDIGSIDEYEAITSIKEEENIADKSIGNRVTFQNDSQYGDVTFDSDNDMTHRADHYQLVNNLNINPEERVKNEIVLKSEPYTLDVEKYDPLNIIDSDINLSQKDSQCIEISLQPADCGKEPEDTACTKILYNYLQSKKSLRTTRKRNAIEGNQDLVKLELDHNIGIPDINNLQSKKSLRTNRKRNKECATKGEKGILQSNPKKTKRKYNKRKTALHTGSIESDILQKRNKRKKKKVDKHSDEDYVPKFENCTESDESECGREYPTKCDDCDSLISTKKEHLYHYLSDHKKIKYPYGKTSLPYVCEICGTKINGEYHFKSHLLTHGEKTVHCKQCPKMFHTRIRMLVHIQRVHAPRKYVCDYCGKRFPDKGAVRLHIRTHTGERPFRCHICGAGFAHKGNRLLHLRQHESRPYQVQDNGANESNSLEQRRKKQ